MNATESAQTVALPLVTVVPANDGHVDAIHALIESATRNSMVLSRDRASIQSHLSGFRVAFAGEQMIGCGVIHIFGPALAEIRSLVVAPEFQSRGVGRRIVGALVEMAKSLGIRRIFVLTDREAPFRKYGFTPTEMATLPEKVWNDCIHCPKYHDCGETALEMILEPDPCTDRR